MLFCKLNPRVAEINKKREAGGFPFLTKQFNSSVAATFKKAPLGSGTDLLHFLFVEQLVHVEQDLHVVADLAHALDEAAA